MAMTFDEAMAAIRQQVAQYTNGGEGQFWRDGIYKVPGIDHAIRLNGGTGYNPELESQGGSLASTPYYDFTPYFYDPNSPKNKVFSGGDGDKPGTWKTYLGKNTDGSLNLDGGYYSNEGNWLDKITTMIPAIGAMAMGGAVLGPAGAGLWGGAPATAGAGAAGAGSAGYAIPTAAELSAGGFGAGGMGMSGLGGIGSVSSVAGAGAGAAGYGSALGGIGSLGSGWVSGADLPAGEAIGGGSLSNVASAGKNAFSGLLEGAKDIAGSKLLPIGASLISGVLGSKAADKAGDAQRDAANAAMAEQRRQFDLTRSDLAPYRNRGVQATNKLGMMMGFEPDQATYKGDFANYKQDPAFNTGYVKPQTYAPSATSNALAQYVKPRY